MLLLDLIVRVFVVGYSAGSYMMTKAVAEIFSPSLLALTHQECTLSLHLFSNSASSSLSVTLKNVKTGEKKSIGRIEELTRSWIKYHWLINFLNDPVQVSLKAVFSSSSKDNFTTPYIAIDDIAFDANCQVLDSGRQNLAEDRTHSQTGTYD